MTEYRNLVSRQNVDMVIGVISSGDCLAVAPVAEEMKKLTVLFDCSTNRIFEEASYKYVFRTTTMATHLILFKPSGNSTRIQRGHLIILILHVLCSPFFD